MLDLFGGVIARCTVRNGAGRRWGIAEKSRGAAGPRPLLDGSRGAPIEIKAAVESIGGPMGDVVMDIPYGPYHGAAKVVLPDGRVFALHCAADFRGPFKADASPQPSVYEMVKPLGIFVSP